VALFPAGVRPFSRSANRNDLHLQPESARASRAALSDDHLTRRDQEAGDVFRRSAGIYQWFIVPYVIPDLGTQQHELSHTFLFFTYPPAEDHPWIKEGTGMYFESGELNRSGNLSVTTPMQYLRDGSDVGTRAAN